MQVRNVLAHIDVDDLEQVTDGRLSLDMVDDLGARFRLASIPDPWGDTITFAHENVITFS